MRSELPWKCTESSCQPETCFYSLSKIELGRIEASTERNKTQIELRNAKLEWKTSTRAICTKDPFADDSFGLGILGSGWQHKLQNQQVFSFSSQTKIEITEAKKLDLKINAAAGGVGAGSTGMRSQVVSVENLVDIRGYSEVEETTESSHPYPELVQYIDEGVKAAITEFQNESDLDVLLVGPLGSGKTSFVWSVMRALAGSLERNAEINREIPANMRIRESSNNEGLDGTYVIGHNHYPVKFDVDVGGKKATLALNDTQGLNKKDADNIDEAAIQKVIEWVKERHGQPGANQIKPAIALLVLNGEELFKKGFLTSKPKSWAKSVQKTLSWKNLVKYAEYLKVFCPRTVLVTKMDRIPSEHRSAFESAIEKMLQRVTSLNGAPISFVENFHRETPFEKWAETTEQILRVLGDILHQAAAAAKQGQKRRVFENPDEVLKKMET